MRIEVTEASDYINPILVNFFKKQHNQTITSHSIQWKRLWDPEPLYNAEQNWWLPEKGDGGLDQEAEISRTGTESVPEENDILI